METKMLLCAVESHAINKNSREAFEKVYRSLKSLSSIFFHPALQRPHTRQTKMFHFHTSYLKTTQKLTNHGHGEEN